MRGTQICYSNLALRHQTWGTPSQVCGPVSLPDDAAVQQQPQAIVGEVAEAVADPLDLLIWTAPSSGKPPVSGLLVFPCCAGGPGGGRAEVGQDRVGAAWIGGPPL